jgi:DNA topoisomerase-2
MENKYRFQSDIEHVLSNTGMYLGSVEPIKQNIWLYNEEKAAVEVQELDFHPALYKIIDEPLTNSYDHYLLKISELI